MYSVNELVKKSYKAMKNNENFKDFNESKLEFLSRLTVYNYLRYKISYKTKIMSFEEYCEFKRLEMSILISDLNYKGNRNLKNGYDHLYNEMKPLFDSLSLEEKKMISKACLDFARDIYNFKYIEKYLKYDPIKTYVRFVTNRYKNIIDDYDLDDDYICQCATILNIVGHNKKSIKASITK